MRFSRLASIATTVALVGVAAGCTVTSGDGTSAATATTSTVVTTTTPPQSPKSDDGSSSTAPPSTWPPDRLHHVAPSPATDAVAAKMLDDIPGFALQPDDVGDTGPSDLDKAADDDGPPDARAHLRKAGFVAGYQRLFLSADGKTTIVLFLYQFADANGAKGFTQHWLEELQAPSTDPGVTKSAPKAVPGLDGATEMSGKDDQGNTMQVVLFHKGAYLGDVLVQSTGSGKGPTPSAADLAVEQAKKL